MLELLKQLVTFETVNDPKNGLRPTKECPSFIMDTLEGWGIYARLIESEGYYGIYGEIGEGEPGLMFMAHFDVVPVNPNEWNTDPFKLTVEGNRAYGRGSADDKGNVAAIMLALKELAQRELHGKILFAFTGDEEIGGRIAMDIARKLREENNLPRYMINADGIGMSPIVRRRKGFGALVEIKEDKITIRGEIKEKVFEIRTPVVETRHAAYFLPSVDTHPMIALSHFLRNTNALAVGIEGAFLKSNVVPGRVKLTYALLKEGNEEVEADLNLTRLLRAVVPLTRAPIKAERYSDYGVSITPNMYSLEGGTHRLYVDIRAMSYSVDDIERTLKEILRFNLEGATLTLKSNEKAGYLFTHPDSPLVRATLEALGELGEEETLMEGPGASDSRFFTPYGVETIDFGPRGGNIHGPNEYVEIDSLKKLPEVYEKVALKLLRA